MIQELLRSGLIDGERRASSVSINNGTILQATTHVLPLTYSHHHLHQHHQLHSSPSPSPSPSPSSSTTPTTSKTLAPPSTNKNSNPPSSSSPSAPPPENLRCPRCDSSNTKFCYYNNYNLTQPRHFCKTCRRYWTKGGALRNVPIGGGCRKNKNTSLVMTSSSSSPSPSSSPSALSSPFRNKSTTVNINANTSTLASLALEFGRSSSSSSPSFFGSSSYNDPPHHQDHLSSSGPMLWAPTQGNSHHLLSLLRSVPSPNPNPNPSSSRALPSLIPPTVKDEVGFGNLFLGTSTSTSTTTSTSTSNYLNMVEPSSTEAARTLGWDTSALSSHQAPSLGLNSASINPLFQTGYVVGGGDGDDNNSGMQEIMYHRLKASSGYNGYSYSDIGNGGSIDVGSSSSSSSSSSAAAPVGGGGELLGYSWSNNGNGDNNNNNQAAYASSCAPSWSDLPSSNGTAYNYP